LNQLGSPIKVFSDEQQALEYLQGRQEPASIRSGTSPTRRGQS
jgi:hypothetical protein